MDHLDAEEPFLLEIANSNGEGYPYAIYADWLSEHGCVWGELIRCELELEEIGFSDQRRRSLTERIRTLRRRHERDWLGDLAPEFVDHVQPTPDSLANEFDYSIEFRRGVCDKISIDHLTPDFAQRLAASKHIRTVREFALQPLERFTPRVTTQKIDIGAIRLLCSGTFSALRQLQITSGPQSDLPHLTDMLAGMPHLESIKVDAGRLDVPSIFEAPLTSLRELWLQGQGEFSLERLAENPHPTKLESLSLMLLNPVSAAQPSKVTGAGDFFRSKAARSLRFLVLSEVVGGDQLIADIIASGLARRLRRLALLSSDVTEAGVELLCSADLNEMRTVEIQSDAAPDSGLRRLSKKLAKNVALQTSIALSQRGTSLDWHE